MLTWFVTAMYAAGAIAAVEAVMTARTAQGAVAWAVSLVSLPFVAVPAYLVLAATSSLLTFGHGPFQARNEPAYQALI